MRSNLHRDRIHDDGRTKVGPIAMLVQQRDHRLTPSLATSERWRDLEYVACTRLRSEVAASMATEPVLELERRVSALELSLEGAVKPVRSQASASRVEGSLSPHISMGCF